jgi:penicillin amidase
VNTSQVTGQDKRRKRPFRMARVVAISVILLVLTVVLAVSAGWLWLRHAMDAQLPQLDGEIEVTGLSAPVTVRRDAQGVPHIEAANLDDLLEAQGYVTAQDRLWQMDMARRLAAGEAAELLGEKLVDHDRAQRVFAFRTTAERIVSTLPPGQLHQIEAYARGVNRFIDDHQEELPAEFRLLRYKPQPWRPVDTVLVALSMAQTLDESWGDKLSREQVTARLGPTLARDLYPTGSWRDHPPVASEPGISDPQPAIPAIPLDESQSLLDRLPVQDIEQLQQLIGRERQDCVNCTPGSNEWVVSGAHTASGKPMLSNDMHLSHGIPEIWYESDLHAGSFHSAGVTVPGLPFITAGHNDHIAWGFTALYGDVQDVYIEQTNAKGEYLATVNGVQSWQPFEHTTERIHVRGAPDVVLDLERTVHGPVVTPLLPHEKRTLSLRWTMYDPKASGLPLYALNTAGDWTSFRAAVANWWEPTLNLVYADDQGHIGYQAVGFIPQRGGGLQPVPIAPNSSGIGEWTGFLPFEELPSAFDPEGGLLATANSRVTPDGYPYQITLEWANPYRNERIWKWLTGKQGLTEADMLKLQTDVYSEVDQQLGFRLAYAIDHATSPSDRQRAAADILRRWDGVVGINAAAPAIVDAAKRAFWPMVLQPKIGDAWKLYSWAEKDYAREQIIAHGSAEWLPPGYKNWDDFLAAMVSEGLKQAHAPARLGDWKYGSAHTIEIAHPIYSILRAPGLPDFAPHFIRLSDVGPLPQSGDQTTVKQVNAKIGPSQRFTIDWAAPDAATENIVSGESGDPLSPYYRDQWMAWYSGTTFTLPFSPAAVAASAAHTLRLVP